MNILIVEDSTLEMQRICRMLHEVSPDSQVLSFTDSEEARDRILQHSFRPDVAFLDIEMIPPNGMELAQLITKEYPDANIVFTTAYTSYMQQAFGLFVSGYLLKPFSQEDLRKQLENLRHPVASDIPVYFAKTIGEFDFFYMGKPVTFPLIRAKEALAYLIDRQGASVTKRELFSILFEDAPYSPGKQDHMKKIMQALRSTLEHIGAKDVLLHARNSYAIDMSRISTDLPPVERRSSVRYMEQYSWADGLRV